MHNLLFTVWWRCSPTVCEHVDRISKKISGSSVTAMWEVCKSLFAVVMLHICFDYSSKSHDLERRPVCDLFTLAPKSCPSRPQTLVPSQDSSQQQVSHLNNRAQHSAQREETRVEDLPPRNPRQSSLKSHSGNSLHALLPATSHLQSGSVS